MYICFDALLDRSLPFVIFPNIAKYFGLVPVWFQEQVHGMGTLVKLTFLAPPRLTGALAKPRLLLTSHTVDLYICVHMCFLTST